MELLAPLITVFLALAVFFAAGVGFAWVAWYVDRAWRGRGLMVLWAGSAVVGTCLLAVLVYSRPASPPAVAGPAPFAVGLPLLLTTFGAAAVYIARHRRAAARPPRDVVVQAGAAHFWAGWGFTIVLILVNEALARWRA